MTTSISLFTSMSLNSIPSCMFSPPFHRQVLSLPKRHRINATAGRKWTEYQGIHNWDGLLNPLDEHLRKEILRYGRFVEAAYNSFEFDITSPHYATSRHPKSTLLDRTGLGETGYRITKYLQATSSIELPKWVERAANSAASTRSSWIGYVAVCEDKEEIARLGRRDVVIAYRGTATFLEWVENLRATLTEITNNGVSSSSSDGRPMVESGFLSLYCCKGDAGLPSLKQTICEEVCRLLDTYGSEPLSFTITGHSLGAALATLTAYHINLTFQQRMPLVTVLSFGGPRVGNREFGERVNKQGTKVLRIVNSEDVITKLPGFVMVDDKMDALPCWIRQRVENTQYYSQWMYSEVGEELKLLNNNNNNNNVDLIHAPFFNMGIQHDLKTYLRLLQPFQTSPPLLSYASST